MCLCSCFRQNVFDAGLGFYKMCIFALVAEINLHPIRSQIKDVATKYTVELVWICGLLNTVRIRASSCIFGFKSLSESRITAWGHRFHAGIGETWLGLVIDTLTLA